jgi:hypothetical protein
MKGALQRVEDIAAFPPGRLKLEQVPSNRLSALARYGLGTKAAKLERARSPSVRRPTRLAAARWDGRARRRGGHRPWLRSPAVSEESRRAGHRPCVPGR